MLNNRRMVSADLLRDALCGHGDVDSMSLDELIELRRKVAREAGARFAARYVNIEGIMTRDEARELQ